MFEIHTKKDVIGKELVAKIQRIVKALPHGSGIDGNWHVEIPVRSKVLRFQNFYHCMTEEGFYDDFCYFSVLINPDDENIAFNMKLIFNGQKSQRLAQKYCLREYLEEMIAASLPEKI